MIEELKDKYYKFEEQKKIYDRYKSKLTADEKYALVRNYMSSRDFWGYSQIIVLALYDVADDSDKFIDVIVKLNQKVRTDLAQGVFLDMLTDIGKNKPELGKRLYEKIMTSSAEDDLKVISGLILGGYALNDFKDLLIHYSKVLNYPETNSLLKAILLYFQNKELNSETKTFLLKVSESKDTKILIEFAFVSMKLINKDKKIFFNYIKDLVKLKNSEISYLIFDSLTFSEIITKKEYFDLVEISKNQDFSIINKIIETLRKYPEEPKKITSLLIYWMNQDSNYKLNQLDWVLGELVQKNKLFIDEFFKEYKQIKVGKSKTYIVAFPHLFETLAKHHPNHALDQILKFNINKEEESYLFFKCSRTILGIIYSDSTNKTILFKLLDSLISISKTRNFVRCNGKKYWEIKNKALLTRVDYDYLIDFADNLLIQLRNRKDNYNFKLINHNLQKYQILYKFAEEVIKEAENKKQYTPLIWLGENEEPKIDDLKLTEDDSELNRAFKLDFARSRFWPRAYLEELDRGLLIAKTKPNDRFREKIDLVKDIKKNLSDENKFWNYLSELTFINKFENYIQIIEPFPPNKEVNNLDLKLNLFKKDIYFEITRPGVDRKLRLANGAVGLANKAFSIIDKKYCQLFATQTLEEIEEGKREDLFFVVIDIGNSTIDEHQLVDSLLGSLAYTWQIDKKTGNVINEYTTRKEDSLSHKNKKTDIISGAIYFKQELIFVDKKPKIILRGDIILNPNAKNKLKEEEIKKLKEIIFN